MKIKEISPIERAEQRAEQINPADIDAEVKTPARIYLEEQQFIMKDSIVKMEENLKINKLLLEHLEKRIEEEKEKLK